MTGPDSDPSRMLARAKGWGGMMDRRGPDRDQDRSVGRDRPGRGNPDDGEAVRTFVVVDERRREVIPVGVGEMVMVVVVVG